VALDRRHAAADYPVVMPEGGLRTSGDPLSRIAPDYRLLVERLPLVVYVDALDDVSSALYMSPHVEELLGYSVAEWISERDLFVRLLHPDDRERVIAEIARSNETDELFHSEYRLVARDGRVVWFEDRAVAVASEQAKAGYALGYMLDITDRRRAEAERRALLEELEREAHAAAVLSHVGDGVFQVDAAGRIRLWNPAAERITGMPAEEALGRRVEDVLAGWEQVADGIDVAPAPGAASRREAVPLGVVGRERWLSISGVDFGEGTVYAFRDLSEERSLEAARRDFLATASHELRTPLASVYGAAQTLLHHAVDEDRHARLLGMIASESERLRGIIDELLLASRVDAGALSIRVAPCDGVALAAEIVDVVRERRGARDVTFASESDVPPVTAEADLLRRVLLNLVDNALKYGVGAVHVAVSEADGVVTFTVRDEGPGIPSSEHERIFEKFYRLDPEQRAGVGGTGLGLYICRELVTRMGGRIWLTSREGGYSAFHVELPRAA
jgi:PAS domain S-box-containing protein